MTNLRYSGRKVVVAALLAMLLGGLVACSSPEEKAQSYYRKGSELLEKGDYAKARLEFQNALQINAKLVPAWYGMAEISERQGDWEGMFKLLNKVLELDPNNLKALVKRGRLLLAAGKLDKAIEVSKKTIEIGKDNVDVLTFNAALQLKLEDTKGALDYANRALQKKPDSIEALVVLATERILAGDAGKAIEYLDRGLKHDEKNVAMQFLKIQALKKLSKLNEAEQVYLKLIEYYPDEMGVRKELAQFYLAQDRTDDAEKVMRSAADRKTDDVDAKLELIRFLSSTKGSAVARSELEAYAAKLPKNFKLQFALVSFYESQKDMNAAEAKLKAIVDSEKDSKDGLTAKGMLAGLVLARGEKAAAEKLVGEILSVDTRNENALVIKASMKLDAKQYDEAIADLRTVLRDVPNSSRALFLLARAHDASGSPELADESYQKAFRAGKFTANLGLPYAQFLLRRNQADRAEKIIDEVLSSEPGNVVALRLLAQSKIARADWMGAMAVADRARNVDEKGSLSEQIKGAVFAGQKNYGESISAFKKVYEASPSEIQPVVALVRTYLAAGKSKEASAFVDSVVQSNPSNASAYVMQGQLALMNGEQQKAVASFNKVIEIQPKQPVGYQQLAMMYLREKKLDEAVAMLDKGLAAIPGDFGLRLAKAGIYEQTTRFDDAIQVYEGMLKDKPDVDVVANNLASLLSEHRTDKASLDRAYQLSQRFKKSDIPQFKDTFGWASYKVGNYEDAKSALQEAVEQLPGMPVFHYHLGMSYLAKQDKVNAKKELQKALELAGNQPFPEADAVRTALKGL